MSELTPNEKAATFKGNMSYLLRRWYVGTRANEKSVGIFVRSEGEPVEFFLWALDDSTESQALLAHIIALHNSTIYAAKG